MLSCDEAGLVTADGFENELLPQFGGICEVMIEQFGVEVCLNMFTRAMNVVKEEGENNGTQQGTN